MKYAPFLLGAALLCAPSLAFADASVSINALIPGTSVGVGAPVSFSVITSGFVAPLTYKLVDSFPGGVVTNNLDAQGTFHWTPNADDIGTHAITVTVSDADGDSASASQTIVVGNHAVSVSATPSAVQYGTPVSFAVSSSGFSSPSYQMVDSYPYSTAAYVSVPQSGVYTWLPVYQDIGTHIFTVTARDYTGVASATQTVIVGGLPSLSLSGFPAMGPTGLTLAVGSTLALTATTTWLVSPSFSIVEDNASTSATIDSSGRVRWTPTLNDFGSHSFTVTATDSAGNSASAKFSASVVSASAYSAPAPVPYAASSSTSSGGTLPTPQASQTSAASISATPVFVSFLTIGSSGAEVEALQQKLSQLGFFNMTPTGYFGSITKAAVQAFQKSVGLEQVGWVGPGTRAALNSRI